MKSNLEAALRAPVGNKPAHDLQLPLGASIYPGPVEEGRGGPLQKTPLCPHCVRCFQAQWSNKPSAGKGIFCSSVNTGSPQKPRQYTEGNVPLQPPPTRVPTQELAGRAGYLRPTSPGIRLAMHHSPENALELGGLSGSQARAPVRSGTGGAGCGAGDAHRPRPEGRRADSSFKRPAWPPRRPRDAPGAAGAAEFRGASRPRGPGDEREKSGRAPGWGGGGGGRARRGAGRGGPGRARALTRRPGRLPRRAPRLPADLDGGRGLGGEA